MCDSMARAPSLRYVYLEYQVRNGEYESTMKRFNAACQYSATVWGYVLGSLTD